MTRDTVLVEGSEATTYLQGQISQDVETLSEGDTAWSLVLEPTGKVAAWFRIHRRDEDTYLLDIDPGHADALIARLERFKLRTDVHFTVTAERIEVPLGWPNLDDPDDERARILAGFPRMGAELTPETIPAEAGRHLIETSVSFTKGCYTGQELVARIDSRGGNVPRPVRLLKGSGPYAVGATVCADGETVGTITSAADDVALAPVLRRVGVGEEVLVDGVAATVTVPDVE